MKIFMKHIINQFIVTHFFSIIIFTIIYYNLFSNQMHHWIFNSNIPPEEYQKNKLINSFYLSVNLQTTSGYMDFFARSKIARLLCALQLCLSYTISIGSFYILVSK
jgi:hypothetical protein